MIIILEKEKISVEVKKQVTCEGIIINWNVR